MILFSKKVKENTSMIRREMKVIKQTQRSLLYNEGKVSEVKNALDGINSILGSGGKKTSEF